MDRDLVFEDPDKYARLIDDLQSKYDELIFAVGEICPNESRHETALRYIKAYEKNKSNNAQMSAGVNL